MRFLVTIGKDYVRLIQDFFSSGNMDRDTHLRTHLKEELSSCYLHFPINNMMTISSFIAAGKSLKYYWGRGSPNTDVRNKSEDKAIYR